MQHPDFMNETKHFEQTRAFIGKLLKEKLTEGEFLIQQQEDINRNMWEDTGAINDLESISDFMQHINLLKQNMAWSQVNRKDIVRLDRQFISPYFARIDFQIPGEDPETYYIGIHSLTDEESSKILIFDWRAPVCSMFYDFEPGDASYLCPAGQIDGKILLKRQYRIEGGKLTLVIESGVAIYDEILQDMLAKFTGGRMKNIVSTIQKEQNQVIRSEGARVLAVQGSAGSGKTSIAMHRAAFLLYQHKRQIRPENLVILSPNVIIGDYIANVLPELGEDEIKGVPFSAVASDVLGKEGMTYGSWAELTEQVLSVSRTDSESPLIASVKIRSSIAFVGALRAHIAALEKGENCFDDILANGQLLMAGDELRELFSVDFSGMNLHRRMLRVDTRLQERIRILEQHLVKNKKIQLADDDVHLSESELRVMSRISIKAELRVVREEILRRFSHDPNSVYRGFLENEEAWRQLAVANDVSHEVAEVARRQALQQLINGQVDWIDGAILLYLGLMVGSVEHDTSAKHVLVDEAQDYTAVHYAAMKLLYPSCGITLLGDENQSISPIVRPLTLQQAAAMLDNDYQSFELLHCYRSTMEITQYAAQFSTSKKKAIAYGRHGDKPEVHVLPTESEMLHMLWEKAKESMSNGMKSIVMLTDRQSTANALYHSLSEMGYSTPKVRLVDEDYAGSLDGVLVMPITLAKGLEFDHVLIPIPSVDAYSKQEEAGIIHTMITRALHRLDLFAVSEVPEIAKQLEQKH